MGKDESKYIEAAGCVVYKGAGDSLEICLIHRNRYDDWSLPKGKKEKDESNRECAIRETFEETGFSGTIEAKIKKVSYVTPKGKQKVVRYWLMRYETGTFIKNDEVDSIMWCSFKKARKKLSYRHDVEVVQAAKKLC